MPAASLYAGYPAYTQVARNHPRFGGRPSGVRLPSSPSGVRYWRQSSPSRGLSFGGLSAHAAPRSDRPRRRKPHHRLDRGRCRHAAVAVPRMPVCAGGRIPSRRLSQDTTDVRRRERGPLRLRLGHHQRDDAADRRSGHARSGLLNGACQSSRVGRKYSVTRRGDLRLMPAVSRGTGTGEEGKRQGSLMGVVGTNHRRFLAAGDGTQGHAVVVRRSEVRWIPIITLDPGMESSVLNAHPMQPDRP